MSSRRGAFITRSGGHSWTREVDAGRVTDRADTSLSSGRRNPSCRDRPYATSTGLVRRKSHAFVSGFPSRADGRFSVHRSRAAYRIKPTGSARLPSTSRR